MQATIISSRVISNAFFNKPGDKLFSCVYSATIAIYLAVVVVQSCTENIPIMTLVSQALPSHIGCVP